MSIAEINLKKLRPPGKKSTFVADKRKHLDPDYDYRPPPRGKLALQAKLAPHTFSRTKHAILAPLKLAPSPNMPCCPPPISLYVRHWGLWPPYHLFTVGASHLGRGQIPLGGMTFFDGLLTLFSQLGPKISNPFPANSKKRTGSRTEDPVFSMRLHFTRWRLSMATRQ